MDGGALLGQGVYGCAFTPPLKCKGKPLNPKNIVERKVGKLTRDFDAYWESTISDHLRQNPLAPNYFILTEAVCQPDVRSEQTEPDLDKCEFIEGKRVTGFKQISMSFGGTPLYSANLRPDRFDFFAFTKHLLEAGAILLLSGIQHGDLHTANILVDEYNVPRIIDFGVAMFPNTLTQDLLQFYAHQPDFQYYQEPPEFSLFWALQAGLTDDDLPEQVVKGKKIFKDLQTLLGVSNTRSATELEIFAQSSQALQTKNGVKLYQTYWPQYDAWSIGVALVGVLKRLSMFHEFQFNQSYAKNKVVLDKVMKGLTEANPMKRLDAIEALNELIRGGAGESESFVLTTYAGEWLSKRLQQRS